jgi:hypothetical protein
MEPVRVTVRKPTAIEIATHQMKLMCSGISIGIEPIFKREYVRRVANTQDAANGAASDTRLQ